MYKYRYHLKNTKTTEVKHVSAYNFWEACEYLEWDSRHVLVVHRERLPLPETAQGWERRLLD